MTDGIASVQLRIAEIQRQFAPPPVAAAAPSQAATTGSFADALAKAQGGSADLSTYANGRIPESALTSIGGGERLAAPAAAAFEQMRADARRAGVTFGVNDSYRSFEDQVKMVKEKGLYGKGGLAAVPGTSNHGLGISVDLQLNGQAQRWMQTNAGKYGYVNDVRGEPWHWTFKR